jgi:putative membrane protein
VYQIELEKPSPENSTKQYKIMTYRCGILSHGLLQYWRVFCILVVFSHSIGNAWLQMPWMHVKLCFCAVFVPANANKFKSNYKEHNQYTQLHADCGMKATIILCSRVFSGSKNAVNWIYGVSGYYIIFRPYHVGICFTKNKKKNQS